MKGILSIRLVKTIKDESLEKVLANCGKIVAVCAASINLGGAIVYWLFYNNRKFGEKIFLLTEAYYYFINPFFVNSFQASVPCSFLYPWKH